jgi:uncharacterized membrane-anchored protein
MKALYAALAITFAACSSSVAQSEKEIAELRAMHPMSAAEAAIVRLEESKATIGRLPSGYTKVAFGQEARRFREIVDGSSSPEQEADAVNSDGSELIYQWIPDGYVASSDWNDVDPDSLLKQVKEADVEANRIRQERGIPTITNTGCRQKPQFDQTTHAVSFAIEGIDSRGGKVVNFVALKLGRYGFERITWVVDPTKIAVRDDLRVAVDNLDFGKGGTYADYRPGSDRAAAYGVAGLVAGALGVKIAKVGVAGAVAGLAVFAKQAGALVMIAFAAIATGIKRLFSRKRRDGSAEG